MSCWGAEELRSVSLSCDTAHSLERGETDRVAHSWHRIVVRGDMRPTMRSYFERTPNQVSGGETKPRFEAPSPSAVFRTNQA